MNSLFALTAIIGLLSASNSAAGEVAYTRLTEGFWQIWVYRTEDGAQRQVTRGASDKHGPAWAPDGAIVFRANDDGLHRVSAAGGKEQPFRRELWPAVDPAFSPKGVLAYTRPRTDVRDVSAIWVAENGKDKRVLTRGPGLQAHPSWSRDSAWIAFEHFRGSAGTDLRRVAANGGANELLIESSAGEHNQKPAYSPDGRSIAYASNRSGDYEIWAFEAGEENGASPPGKQLTHEPGMDTHPAWSPDSRSLAFTTHRRGRFEIWVMGADGRDPRPLFESDSPSSEPAWR